MSVKIQVLVEVYKNLAEVMKQLYRGCPCLIEKRFRKAGDGDTV